MKNKLHKVVNPDGSHYGYHFQCPGCEDIHTVTTGTPNGWGFNNDLVRPTFTPSVLCKRKIYTGPDTPQIPVVCHSFVTDGMIKFLSDCTHKLAGQTAPLGNLPDWLND